MHRSELPTARAGGDTAPGHGKGDRDMVGQMTLDSLGGINWESPRLEQLQQFALDHVPGADVALWHIKGVGMTVMVRLGLRRAWMKPSLKRTALDTLEWVVLFQAGEGNGYVDLRSDAELEQALDDVFGGEA